MSLLEITKKYSELEMGLECCPSCSSVLDYAKAKADEVCAVLGSGKGGDAILLAEMVGEGGYVYGIDLSDKMLEDASSAAQDMGIFNVDFKKSSFNEINLKSEGTDLVISNCTINRISEKQVVWNEIYRILQKGGRFVISDVYSTTPFPGKNKNVPVTRNEYLDQLASSGFPTISILEESTPYLKDGVLVVNWIITGEKPLGECSWCSHNV